MFAADPYTYTGAEARIKLSRYFQIEVDGHAGADMTPWVHSASLNALLMVRWVSADNRDPLYGGTPALGNGNFTDGHDNLQQVIVIWGYQFTPKIHMMTEAYDMWERNALKGGTVTNGPSNSYFAATGRGDFINGTSSSVAS